MIIISWNCRGLGNPWTVRDLCRLVREKRPNMVFLMETILPSKRLEKIRVKTGFNHVFGVDCVGRSGGLAILWNDDSLIEIQNFSRRHINAVVRTTTNGQCWKFTGFYGNPEAGKRHESWSLMRHLNSLLPEKWLCCGDFNEISEESEKFGGNRQPRWQMENFNQMMVDCNLIDLGFFGPKFTWCNHREGAGLVRERLDRGVANPGWCELFPEARVEVLAARCSDHAPIVISLKSGKQHRQGRKMGFRYEASWCKNPQVKGVIKSVWRVREPASNAWRRVRGNLKESKKAILQWRRINVGPTEEDIKQKTAEIQKLQAAEDQIDVNKIRGLQKEVSLAMEQDEIKWRQRAKELWLKSGDKNSKFFHACATQRQRMNKITIIEDEEGVIRSTQEDIEVAFVNYFKNLFNSSGPNGVDDCLRVLPSRVTENMNRLLTRDFDVEEVNVAIQQMAPLKSPGPDGLPTSFYQDNWEVVKGEVCEAISSFFHMGCFEKEVNRTHIVLIPKIRNPSKVTDFRPISLCNVLYKILSKVLANRLKMVLPDLISKNQSAFVPGRLISDNILVAYEAMHTMHSRMWSKVGYMALKLDMSKAYDRVEWPFLEAAMRRMGFDGKWINWIMNCVTTVQYSVLVNGAPIGDIQPSRGIRQGDPLSPYLFLICAEVLSAHLHAADRRGALSGVPTSPGGPRLNHLFFADDSLIFCKAKEEDWNQLTAILDCYEKASGQRLNKDKTSIFFSRNTSSLAKECILQLSGIPDTQRYDKYLGLPSIVGRSRIREFQNIMDRVRKKIGDWKSTFLSQAGKEVMIKAVLQAIPTYTMSIFLLPKELCRELNTLMQKFWWGHKENDKKISWLSWEKMGISKAKGGMGFRDLVSFNKALLAKQGWRLVQDPNSLPGSILKAKYFPRGSFLDAKVGSRPSYAWRSILAGRELLQEGLFWRVGNGRNVRIWRDKWLPRASTYRIQSPRCGFEENTTVEALIDRNTGSWDKILVGELFLEPEATIICNIPLSRYGHNDKLIWRATTSGVFSVRSAYHLEISRKEQLQGEGSNPAKDEVIWKVIWHLNIPNSARVFIWRACKNILPTKVNLKRRGVLKDDVCLFCQREPESAGHVLWECPSSRDVWAVCGRRIQKSTITGMPFKEIMEWMMGRCNKQELELFAVIAKRIWARRNQVLHGGEFINPNRISQEAEAALQQFQQCQEVNREQQAVVPDRWQPPLVGRYKVNWDVAVDNALQRIGVGVLVRDYQGLVHAALCKTIHSCYVPVVAEAIGALIAAEFSRDLGIQDIVLEGDALLVVKAIKDSGPQWNLYGHIVEDIRAVLNNLRSWFAGHAKREANFAAHFLAKEAVKNVMDQIWMEEVPNCIENVVTLEQIALSD
jgi:ribonuclease HI/exonuclease III